MKKIFSLIVLCAFALTAFAQTTTPRFGSTPNQDNTGRALNYKYLAPTDGSGADTIKLVLNAYHTIVKPAAINDTLSFNFTSVAKCYAGDKATFILSNASGSNHQVRFVGSNVQVGSGGATLALTSAKLAVINFIFTGATWLEVSRLVQ